MAEGARLESVYTGNRIGGSNPPPSANQSTGFTAFLMFVASPPKTSDFPGTWRGNRIAERSRETDRIIRHMCVSMAVFASMSVELSPYCGQLSPLWISEFG